MEHNPAAAVRANVLGTTIVADACRQFGSERIILLSTTRAVNPTTVLGFGVGANGAATRERTARRMEGATVGG